MQEKKDNKNQVLGTNTITFELDYISGELNLEKKSIKMLLESIVRNNNKIVIFAGAGISALFGLPLWNDFANQLLEDCYNDGLLTFNQKEEYKKATGDNSKLLITLVYNKYKERNEKQKFYKHFNDRLSSDSSSLENEFISIINALNCSIVTTNADCKLDECIVDRNDRIFYKKEYFEDDNSIKLDKPSIFHIHGSIKDTESLVFTVNQYLSRYSDNKNNNFKKKISNLLRSNDCTLLIMGSSMSEMELLQYLFAKDRMLTNKFILEGFYTYQEDLVKAHETYYKDCFGIQLITYSKDEKGYNNIVEFLKALFEKLSPTNKIELYEKCVEIIKKGNNKKIIDSLKNKLQLLDSIPLSNKIFNELNKLDNVQTIYVDLYNSKDKEYFFNISSCLSIEETIPSIVLNNLVSLNSSVYQKNFLSFINKLIDDIGKIIFTDNYDLENNYRFVFCFLKLISINHKKRNSKMLIKLINSLLEKNVSFISSVIFELSEYIILFPEEAYNIAKLLLKSNIAKESRLDMDDISIFMTKNIDSILGSYSSKFFDFIINILNEMYRKEPLHFYDLGAIYDYVGSNYYVSYNKFVINYLIITINHLHDEALNDSFKAIKENNSPLDLKIKLYFIDAHFDELKEYLTLDMIDNIDSVASLCYIIKHHYDYLISNIEYKDALSSLIDKCKFEGESEKDVLGLKYILHCFIDGKDYSINKKYDSKYENYEFYNIGKHFWTSIIPPSDGQKIFDIIKDYKLNVFIDYLNNQKGWMIDLDNAIESYFNNEKNMVSLLKQPDLFLKINNKEFYNNILFSLLKDNSINKTLINKFLESVLETFDKDNFWLWINIIEKNRLIKEESFNGNILNCLFDKIIDLDFTDNKQPDDSISFYINNVLFNCLKCIFDLHIKEKNINKFVEQIFNKYKNHKNFHIILASISFNYEKIYSKYNDVKKYISEIIGEEKKLYIIGIYNTIVFSNPSLTKEFIDNGVFKKYFPDLDEQAMQYYCQLIILNYDKYSGDLVSFISEQCRYDLCSEAIEKYIHNNDKSLSKLMIIIDNYINSHKISFKLLTSLIKLLSIHYKNKKIRKYINCVDKFEYKIFADWKKIEDSMIKILSMNEDFCIKTFDSITRFYINSTLIRKNEYYALFKKIYDMTTKEKNKKVLSELAASLFNNGLEIMKEFVK